MFKIIREKTTEYQIPKTKSKEGVQDFYLDLADDREEMVDNFIFEDTLTYVGYFKGKRIIDFYFSGTNNSKYIIKINKLHDIIIKGMFIGGKIKGTFTFYKVGNYYTLGLDRTRLL